MNGWVVRNNTFERRPAIAPESAARLPLGRQPRYLGLRAGVQYSYNVGKKCGGAGQGGQPGSSSSGSVTAAFGWVNPGAYDFHLTPGSPAINAGDPADSPGHDRDGNARDSTPDAGAYEF